MQITTLGPLAVDGRVVEGSRLPALLRRLLLARGRIVPAADLVDAVWDGAPPADASGALQALVTRTRRLGLSVTATAGGYRLDATGLEVDALIAQDRLGAARAATAAGDHARAASLAAQGLALWPDDDARATGPAGRLYTDLLALRVEAALAAGPARDAELGRGVGLLDALRDAVGQRPTDEPLTDLLMRALAAHGRDGEALAAYARLRDELAQTYGTDPSAAVGRTHVALLRGELTAPAQTPSGPPAGAPASAPARPAWRRPTTPMLGRAADVAALERALATAPLVTVIAVGGAGKTRLAVEVARRASERGEAVHAVELASVRDPAEILPALLTALGAAETAADADGPLERRVLAPRERMIRAVATLEGLLVLDNCEHLLAPVADIATQVLAAAGPGLRVLATSRAALGVVGEAVHPVHTLADDAALALLESRARALRPALAWDRVVALELCHRLDNLPLALELAAARLRSMPLTDVLAGVEHRFALLDHALRGLPDRHAGLWAMVDWSWALLEPAARALLRDLAVVPAPFTADLAAAVGRVAGPDGAGSGLAVLVDQSLLTLEEPGGGRPARYRMLETVREYGEARLALDGARDEVMERLADWAAVRARSLRAGYVGPGQLAALAATTDEHDTLVAALRWSVDRERARPAFAVAGALLTLWTMRGLHLEVLSWSRQLLRADEPVGRRAHLDPAHGPDPADADDVASVAAMVTVNGGIGNDLRVAALAVRLAGHVREARDGALSPRAAALVRLTAQFGIADDAVHLAAAAELIAAADPYLHGVGLFIRASLRENGGDVDDSFADVRAAYAFFELAGDHWGMGMAAMAVGRAGVSLDSAEADDWLTLAMTNLSLVGAVQDTRTLGVYREMRRALDGSAEAAAGLATTATAASSTGAERSHALIGLAILAAQGERWDEATERGDAAVSAARADEQSSPQGRIVTEVAAAVLRLRAGRDAEGLLAVAGHGALSTSDMPVLGAVALGYAELAHSRDEPARADELWALGMRLGANFATMFGPPAAGLFELAPNDARTALLERARASSAADTVARIAALIAPS
ncbi:ATP-binding protein [Pengzhenrongella sicca]|uniref:Transcriptional regulator n=1 Tax=Pengzhenrongella sicca TaxID=2819238 RepID=A0A8A4ZBN4_9MICO|nr:BTAD domain-containing putative transcriptional regulator [Pengzhenrongella sicca]QTE29322.1 transcriptional regulator [Pengzhenrongella sicca]